MGTESVGGKMRRKARSKVVKYTIIRYTIAFLSRLSEPLRNEVSELFFGPLELRSG